jgi:hypothetical protein
LKPSACSLVAEVYPFAEVDPAAEVEAMAAALPFMKPRRRML